MRMQYIFYFFLLKDTVKYKVTWTHTQYVTKYCSIFEKFPSTGIHIHVSAITFADNVEYETSQWKKNGILWSRAGYMSSSVVGQNPTWMHVFQNWAHSHW